MTEEQQVMIDVIEDLYNNINEDIPSNSWTGHLRQAMQSAERVLERNEKDLGKITSKTELISDLSQQVSDDLWLLSNEDLAKYANNLNDGRQTITAGKYGTFYIKENVE